MNRIGIGAAIVAATAVAHVAWLHYGYGTRLFGVAGSGTPYWLVVTVWLGASTAVALASYRLGASRWWPSSPGAWVFAVAASLASLYVGAYSAINTFGT